MGIACLVLVVLLGVAPAVAKSDRPRKLSPKILTEKIQSQECEVHYGDLSVAAGDSAAGPMAVVEGSLDLAAGSVVTGTVWIVNGDLILSGDATLDGPVHLVNGQLFQAREATLSGSLRKYRCECRLDAPRYETTNDAVFIHKEQPNALGIRRQIGLGPVNRADYSSLMIGAARGDENFLRPHWRGHAQLIFPFRDNTRGYLGFDMGAAFPVSGRRAELRVAGFKKTVTNDDWQLSYAENAAMLELSHNDFFDYYERSGGRIGLWLHPKWEWQIEGGVYFDHSQSLETRSVPSLANNGRPLRDNPPIDEGEILGGTIAVTYDTRIAPEHPKSAWFGSARLEHGFADGPGDFYFTTLTLDLSRYNRLWRAFNIDFHGRIFTAFDDLPRQRQQSLNGYGGVRGLHDIPFDVRRGDRVGLFSTELRIPMPDLPVMKILFTRWDLTAFGDLGLLALEGGSEGAFAFLDTKLDDWGKSVGIGISGESFLPYVGLYVAQDLDRHNKRPRFIIRANRSF